MAKPDYNDNEFNIHRSDRLPIAPFFGLFDDEFVHFVADYHGGDKQPLRHLVDFGVTVAEAHETTRQAIYDAGIMDLLLSVLQQKRFDSP